jgi:hypothetical protein
VEAEPDAGHVVAMMPFVFSCLGKAGTKPFRVEGREKEVKWKARTVESTNKKDQKKRAARLDRTALKAKKAAAATGRPSSPPCFR